MKSGLVIKFLGHAVSLIICKGNHFKGCGATLTMDNVKVIVILTKSVYNLMTLKALFFRSIKLTINTKDEYKSRTLIIKI